MVFIFLIFLFFFTFQFYLKSFNHSNGLRPILTKKKIKPNNQWRNWLFGPNSDRILPKIDQIQTNISQIPAKILSSFDRNGPNIVQVRNPVSKKIEKLESFPLNWTNFWSNFSQIVTKFPMPQRLAGEGHPLPAEVVRNIVQHRIQSYLKTWINQSSIIKTMDRDIGWTWSQNVANWWRNSGQFGRKMTDGMELIWLQSTSECKSEKKPSRPFHFLL